MSSDLDRPGHYAVTICWRYCGVTINFLRQDNFMINRLNTLVNQILNSIIIGWKIN